MKTQFWNFLKLFPRHKKYPRRPHFTENIHPCPLLYFLAQEMSYSIQNSEHEKLPKNILPISAPFLARQFLRHPPPSFQFMSVQKSSSTGSSVQNSMSLALYTHMVIRVLFRNQTWTPPHPNWAARLVMYVCHTFVRPLLLDVASYSLYSMQ